MAVRFNPFGFLDDIQHRVRRTLFTPQDRGAEPPTSTPPSTPPTTGTVPRFTPPPPELVDKEQPGVVYEARDREGTRGRAGTADSSEPEDQISFIPISPGRLGRSASAIQGRVQARQVSAEHILLIAARPKSFVNLFLDEVQKLAAEIPILRLVINKPRSQEEMVAQAIQRYISENPQQAESQIVRDLKENTNGITQEVVTTTGQVKALRIIPEEKIAEEQQRPAYQRGQESYLQVQIQPGRLIRFLPQETFERFLSTRAPSFLRGIAGSAAREAAHRGAIFGSGLVNSAIRGAGGWIGRGAVALGSQLASAGAVLTGSTVGVPLAIIIGGVIIIGVVFLLLGQMFIRQAAFVGTGGAGDLLAQGNQYIAVEIIPSKTSIPNNGLPTGVVFKINIQERKVPFTAGPNITTVVTAGSRTLASQSWSEREHELKIDLPADIQDVNLIVNVTAKASVSEQTNEQTAANSTSVRIGNPPDDCPSSWPTAYGQITLGPNTSGTHATAEAIDIGNGGTGGAIKGILILSTTKGKVSYDCYSFKYGTCVRVTTTCQGKTVDIIYAHMQNGSRKVQDEGEVTAGMQLGNVGATGNVFGDDPNHLHYEFFKIGGKVTIPMTSPYIPSGTRW